MFKKIAHNSTIPALGHNINQDLKPLQNLIAAEKTVLISLQKLSVDYSKASEALRTWSLSEGGDLEGILGASTSILHHFSSALSQYAAHGHSMRDQLKAIRTREESLDDLERRRRGILRKAEDADRKLSKMGPENKHFPMQTDTLNRLREDIRAIDSEIMLGEATLGDFKRSATKVWMGLKFGGLVECCEKGLIAGEFGRLAIAEISEETTQPGLPRNFNYPHNKIEDFVAEAYRGVNMVTLSTFPSAESSQYDQHSSDAPAFYISMPTAYEEPYNNTSSRLSRELQPPPTSNNASSRLSVVSTSHDDNANYQAIPPFGSGNGYPPENSSFSHSAQQLGVNEGAMDDFGTNVRSTGPYHQQHSSQGTVNSSFSQRANEGAVDDFGVNARSTGSPYQQQFFEESPNTSFSQTPSSQRFGVKEGAVDNFGANVRSTPPYQQQFFEKSANPSFSQASPSSQQPGVNKGAADNFGANVRSTGSPYQQQFSQGAVNSSFSRPSQQLPVNEGTVDANVRSTVPPYQHQFSQGPVNSSFSQTVPLSPHLGAKKDTADDFNVRSTGPPNQQQLSQGSANALLSYQQLRVSEGAMDDFGANVHATGTADSSNAAGGRFATFPVPTRSPGSTGGYTLQDQPSGRHLTGDSSFSASIADALHEKFDDPNSETKSSPRATNQFNDGSQSSTNSEGTTRGFYNQPTNNWDGRSDSDPRPSVSITAPSLQVPVGTNKQSEFANPRGNPPLEGSSKASTQSRFSQASEYDAILAYMSEDPGSGETPTKIAVPSSDPPATAAAAATTALSSPHTKEEDNRHVRFGDVEDVDQGIEKRVSLEKEQAANTGAVGPRNIPRTAEINSTENNPPQPTTPLHPNTRSPSQPIKSASWRVPPPNIDSWEEDEKALNAATAREISLELEALQNNNQNQVLSQVDQRFQPAPNSDVDGGRAMPASTLRFNKQLPNPYAEPNQPGTYPHYSTSQPYVQAAYQTPPDSPGQSFQHQQKQQASDMRNILPPRFQAYNNVPVESQVPPRFQNSSSSIVNSPGPRFQTNYTPQVSAPGGLNS